LEGEQQIMCFSFAIKTIFATFQMGFNMSSLKNYKWRENVTRDETIEEL